MLPATSHAHNTQYSVRKYYDAFYADQDFHHYSQKVYHKFFRQLFSKYNIRASSLILDIGCSTGVQIETMVNMGMQPVGVDVSRVGLKKSSSRNTQTPFVLGDAVRLPFSNDTFDAIISFGCSEMNTIAPDQAIPWIHEAISKLKTGGTMFITSSTDFSGRQPSGWHMWKLNAIQYFVSSFPMHSVDVWLTLPKLATVHAPLLFQKLTNVLLRFPLPIVRTVVFVMKKL